MYKYYLKLLINPAQEIKNPIKISSLSLNYYKIHLSVNQDLLSKM